MLVYLSDRCRNDRWDRWRVVSSWSLWPLNFCEVIVVIIWKPAFPQQVFYLLKPYNLPTSTFTVAETFPKWFSAKQVYVYHPPRLQTVWGNSSVVALIIIVLGSFALYHVILGSGFPSTGQQINAGQFSWDTFLVRFPSISNGATEREKRVTVDLYNLYNVTYTTTLISQTCFIHNIMFLFYFVPRM